MFKNIVKLSLVMSEERKSFFKERSVREIGQLRVQQVHSQSDLLHRLADLNQATDSLEIRLQIIPEDFFKGGKTGAEASRLCYKHGELIQLSQPKTQTEAYRRNEIPLAIRKKDFLRHLESKAVEDISYVGYSWHPVQGRDRRKRVVHFSWLPEAIKLFGYAETKAFGIPIIPYADSKRVSLEGADIVCLVPSRTKKKQRYVVKLRHVPVDGGTEKRAVIWSLRPEYEPGEAPGHNVFNIRYTGETQREASDIVTFYPHDIAAYIAIAGHFWKKHNLTPMEMIPFALPSRKGAELYNKLCNNVVIYDPSLRGIDKFRKLHIAEKDIILARCIGVFGHDEIAFWDFKERDGKLKDYDWTVK